MCVGGCLSVCVCVFGYGCLSVCVCGGMFECVCVWGGV